MLKKVSLFIFLLLITNSGIAHAKFDFFGFYERSDKYSDSFLDEYKKVLKDSNSKEVKKEVALYREAYFLLIDNYIYEVNNEEKEKLSQKSKEALNKSIEKLKKENKEITPSVLMEEVMNTVFNDIDAHTVYMDSKRANEFRANITGNHKGIGVLFNFDKDKNMIYIVKVFNNSPSQKAGMLSGDYIKSVDGKDINPQETLENVIDAIRGENGTVVKLAVVRGERTFDVDVVRGDYYIPSVESKIIDNDYAYININSFNQDTASLFRSDINSLQVNRLKGMIIDVRNNPGGLLTAVVIIADTILSGEPIVSIKGREKANNQTFLSFNQTQVRDDLPIVILTNSNSASASELLAGAMAINKRGTIIGDNTFGKWSVQSSFTLTDKSIFNVTTQLFYSPKDATFQGSGISPDIKITESDNYKHFREKDYNNYLKVSDIYNRKPQYTLKDKSCPAIIDGDRKDYVLGCAVLYLKSNSDLEMFKKKVG